MSALYWLRRMPWLPERKQFEWFPPFWLMRVKVVEISAGWRRVRLRLPLSFWSKNMGGTMFGGHQASLADPVAALACAHVFPGYHVWTRSMQIDFRHPGATDLELRFEFPEDVEVQIGEELARKGRSTPEFEYGLYQEDGTCCTWVHNRVAIRPKGYRKPVAEDR